MTERHPSLRQRIEHGHLDQWDLDFGLTRHSHEGGDKRHRHNGTAGWQIRPTFRYVPPSLLDRPYKVADWSDTSDL